MSLTRSLRRAVSRSTSSAELLVLVVQRAAGAEQLDRSGDRAERVSDLVGEAGGEAAEEGEALGLLGAGGRALEVAAGRPQALGEVAREQR